MRNGFLWLCVVALLTMSGCASMIHPAQSHQVASVVDYLYPSAEASPKLREGITTLRPPIRVGLAFVPGTAWDNNAIPEAERERLLERVRGAFIKYPFIESIELIPSNYLRPGGGFTNLEQTARMFNVDVVALVSYDQIQFNDLNSLAVLYWTLVGAYIIHGDQYDIQTMVDAAVFDVKSHKLLFRAPGVSRVKGASSLTGFSESARAARLDGYDRAVDDLNQQLSSALGTFKERIKTDPSIRIDDAQGRTGGGGFDLAMLVLLGTCAALARRAPAEKAAAGLFPGADFAANVAAEEHTPWNSNHSSLAHGTTTPTRPRPSPSVCPPSCRGWSTKTN